MRLPYDLVILDLEANQPSDKIIEIGAVKLMREGGIHPDQFSALISIDEPVTQFIENLTGISNNMLKNAKQFDEAAEEFEKWAFSGSKNIILCSWGNWDIPCLLAEYRRFKRPYPFRGKSFDVKSILVWVTKMFGIKTKTDGLGAMLKVWQMPFEGDRHRAKNDAYMTAKLLQKLWKDWEQRGSDLLRHLGKIGIK